MREVVETWCAVLHDVDDGQLMASVALYLSGPDSRWMPSPGELRGILKPATSDPGLDDWARLRRLRALHRAQQPTPPEQWDASRVELHEHGLEALCRWRALSRCGCLDDLTGLDHATFVAAYRAEAASMQARAGGAPSKPGQRPAVMRPQTRRAILTWLDVACAEDAWAELAGLASQHGRAARVADPREPRPYRIHDDADREAAMWAGLRAAGGWCEIWPDGSPIPDAARPSDAANRKAFLAAHAAVMRRSTQRREVGRIAALAGMTADALMLDTGNVVALEVRR